MGVGCRRWAVWLWIGAMLALASGVPARACSTPVFQYALLNWLPDAYRLVVFHRGPMGKVERALVDRLGQTEPPQANLRVRTVDLAAKPDPAMVSLWKSRRSQRLPGLVLRYPESVEATDVVWSGPLTTASAKAILDSPMRRAIVRAIMDVHCAVWVLLESGDADKDEAVAKLLQTALDKAGETLRLPRPSFDEPEPAAADNKPGEPNVSFSLLRLSRTDPAEQMLVAMLLGSEADLKGLSEPMAFPVFGRGRVLYALVGKGINHENALGVCTELVGACSCEVKAQHAGMELLMAVNWDRLIADEGLGEVSLPPLEGFSQFVSMPSSTGAATQPAAATAPTRTQARTASPPPSSGTLVRNVVIVLAGLVVAVGIAWLVMRRWLSETRG